MNQYFGNDSIELIHFKHRNFYDSIRLNSQINHNNFDLETISENEEVIKNNSIIISSNLPLKEFDSNKIYIDNRAVKLTLIDPFLLELSLILKSKKNIHNAA